MSRSLVQSLLRAMDILEQVAASQDGLPLRELAARLGLKEPTVHNLARTLISRGYLSKRTHPIRYVLGAGVSSLSRIAEEREWRRRVEAGMREVFAKLRRATVILAEPMGGDIVPTLRMDPAHPELLEHVVNRSLVPYGSVVMICAQAHLGSEEQAEFRRRYPFVKYGAGAWPDLPAFEALLAQSRREGFVLSPGGLPPRAAVPILGRGGQLVACLGACLKEASQPLDQAGLETLVETLQNVARLLSGGPVGRQDAPPLDDGGL